MGESADKNNIPIKKDCKIVFITVNNFQMSRDKYLCSSFVTHCEGMSPEERVESLREFTEEVFAGSCCATDAFETDLHAENMACLKFLQDRVNEERALAADGYYIYNAHI